MRSAKTNENQKIEGSNLLIDTFTAFKEQIDQFLLANPLNMAFIRREKGRLPYSVFKPHSNEITFLKSIFENRPPTAFF